MWVGNRLQHLVLDFDPGGRFSGQPLCVGHDTGDSIPGRAGRFADRNQHGPILLDQTHPSITWHIGCREDLVDARQRPDGRGIDRQQRGPGMVGEP